MSHHFMSLTLRGRSLSSAESTTPIASLIHASVSRVHVAYMFSSLFHVGSVFLLREYEPNSIS